MTPEKYMELLKIVGGLKARTRHCWIDGRQESVADHSWRIAMMAMLLKDEMPDIDMAKVVDMCLIHDWGEAITGDIPTFFKTQADEDKEDQVVDGLAAMAGPRVQALFAEMRAMETKEARLYKALDKIEAVISHNESDLDTWLPLEYTKNLTYGAEQCAEFPFLAQLREIARQDTLKKTGVTENV